MIELFRLATRAVFGTRTARRDKRAGEARASNPADGTRFLFADKQDGKDPFEERPIFVLSAGWRAGSTLVQRLVASGERVLLWGEPYDRAAPVQRLSASTAPFSDAWPPAGYPAPPEHLDDLSKSWTATLYPPQSALAAAHRAFMLRLFAEPARTAGAVRWGLKEVRFGHAEAVYLHALFPQASFVFVRRRIEDAWRSYRNFSGATDWYARWPHRPVHTPYAFARHCARLQAEFHAAAEATGGMILDYEALVTRQIDWSRLSALCNVEINPSTLDVQVGSGRRVSAVTPIDRLMLAAGGRHGRLEAFRLRP